MANTSSSTARTGRIVPSTVKAVRGKSLMTEVKAPRPECVMTAVKNTTKKEFTSVKTSMPTTKKTRRVSKIKNIAQIEKVKQTQQLDVLTNINLLAFLPGRAVARLGMASTEMAKLVDCQDMKKKWIRRSMGWSELEQCTCDDWRGAFQVIMRRMSIGSQQVGPSFDPVEDSLRNSCIYSTGSEAVATLEEGSYSGKLNVCLDDVEIPVVFIVQTLMELSSYTGSRPVVTGSGMARLYTIIHQYDRGMRVAQSSRDFQTMMHMLGMISKNDGIIGRDLVDYMAGDDTVFRGVEDFQPDWSTPIRNLMSKEITNDSPSSEYTPSSMASSVCTSLTASPQSLASPAIEMDGFAHGFGYMPKRLSIPSSLPPMLDIEIEGSVGGYKCKGPDDLGCSAYQKFDSDDESDTDSTC